MQNKKKLNFCQFLKSVQWNHVVCFLCIKPHSVLLNLSSPNDGCYYTVGEQYTSCYKVQTNNKYYYGIFWKNGTHHLCFTQPIQGVWDLLYFLQFMRQTFVLPSFSSNWKRHTLESGIDVGQGITVGPGKFVKKNKRRALNKRRA